MIKNKRGEASNLPFSNLVEILLNIIFFGILILFLIVQDYKISFLETNYAKNIALLIDSAKPGMKISFDLSDALKTARTNGINPLQMVQIQDNKVLVKLKNTGGNSYSFFNDVDVNSYAEYINGYTGKYNFEVLNYKKKEEVQTEKVQNEYDYAQ